MKRIALQAARRRAQGSICQFCEYSTFSPAHSTTPLTAALSYNFNSKPTPTYRRAPFRPRYGIVHRAASTLANGNSEIDPNSALKDILSESRAIITGPSLPSEESVLHLLEKSSYVVDIALSKGARSGKNIKYATSSVLGLDDERSKPSKTVKEENTPEKNFQLRATAAVSSMLNELLRDPKIFISPKILEQYTTIQCRLGRIDHIPEIFTLYANKPAPQSNGSEITFRKPNPKSPQNAIPVELSDKALHAAIGQKNLSLALAIVDCSFCTPAFYRSKLIRKAAIPAAGLAATPPAAYMAASYIAGLQSAMDPSTLTWVSFSAILAYVTFTSSVGLVALTTSNDQTNRMVWLPGTPLRNRWLREEERRALDQIAVAWGFKDPEFRGEEQGEEWENLRELIGLRGMILDKTSLMEGME